jgi:hypothetical protein
MKVRTKETALITFFLWWEIISRLYETESMPAILAKFCQYAHIYMITLAKSIWTLITDNRNKAGKRINLV